jgi:signal transduction histidine kinase
VVLRIGRRGLALVGDDSSSITQGMSMSLLVVKRTIEAGGGRVEFCSSMGQGVTFTVHLPPPAAAA